LHENNIMTDILDDEISYDSDGNQIRNEADDIADNANDVVIDDDTSTSSELLASGPNVGDDLFAVDDAPTGEIQDRAVDIDEDILFADDDDDEAVCPRCASSPCEWIELGDAVIQQAEHIHHRQVVDGQLVILDDNGVEVPNSKMRKLLYKTFTYLKFGHLGKNNRIPIPSCVCDKIREMHPDPEGNYVGFHEDYNDNGTINLPVEHNEDKYY
jgi:hypothetical protein